MPSAFWLLTTHWTPPMTVARSVTPEAPATLTDASDAFGASPTSTPFDDAPLPAINPLTKVPWP